MPGILSTGGSLGPRNLTCPKLSMLLGCEDLPPDISHWLIAAYEEILHPLVACDLGRFTVFQDGWGGTRIDPIPLDAASRATFQPSVSIPPQDSQATSGKEATGNISNASQLSLPSAPHPQWLWEQCCYCLSYRMGAGDLFFQGHMIGRSPAGSRSCF